MAIVYLINMSSSVPLKDDIPQRVWIGKDVSYQHLKVFECLTYMHVAKDLRSKLDNKSKPCIFWVTQRMNLVKGCGIYWTRKW